MGDSHRSDGFADETKRTLTERADFHPSYRTERQCHQKSLLRMNKFNSLVIIFWMFLSLFIMALSYDLGLGGFSNPGAGFVPFFASLFILVISFGLLISRGGKKANSGENLESAKAKPNFKRVIMVVLSLFLYAFLLEKLGFPITTGMFLVVLFWSVGYKWRFVLISSVSAVLITYFFFTYLGVRFPLGILESLIYRGS